MESKNETWQTEPKLKRKTRFPWLGRWRCWFSVRESRSFSVMVVITPNGYLVMKYLKFSWPHWVSRERVNNCWWGWQNRTDLGKCTRLYDETRRLYLVPCWLFLVFRCIGECIKKKKKSKKKSLDMFCHSVWIKVPSAGSNCTAMPATVQRALVFRDWIRIFGFSFSFSECLMCTVSSFLFTVALLSWQNINGGWSRGL